jgi:hypothetical protein
LTKLVAVMGVGCGVVAFSAPAFAAGSGYEGNTGPTGVPGGFASVVTALTIPVSGGTVPATVGGYTVTVTVPSGALTEASVITITSGTTTAVSANGENAVVAIGINVTDPSTGDKFTGTFANPIAVTISGTFSPADTVVAYDTTSSSWQTVPGAVVTNGQVNFTITSDPDLAVLASASSVSTTANSTPASGTAASATTADPPVAGATQVTTGKPFLLEEIIAGALIVMGALALVWLKRRRPSNRW